MDHVCYAGLPSDPVTLSILIHRIAKLGEKARQKVDRINIFLLVKNLKNVLKAIVFDTQGITNTLWALAKLSELKMIPVQAFNIEKIWGLTAVALTQLTNMMNKRKATSQNIANSLCALAKLADQGIIHAQSLCKEGLFQFIARALTQLTGWWRQEKPLHRILPTACGRWVNWQIRGIIHAQSLCKEGLFPVSLLGH